MKVRMEIGRTYPKGNLGGQEGEPLFASVETDPTIHYFVNGQLVGYNPITKRESRTQVPYL